MIQDSQRQTQKLDILTFPDARLRRVSEPIISVTHDDRELIRLMFDAMEEAGGLGLAAPQVGINKRIVIVDVTPLDAYEGQQDGVSHGRLALVNPSFTAQGGEAAWREGCLSVPGVEADVIRPAVIDLHALDEEGEPIELKASGLLAACIQHEIDHLDGVLFVDRLSRLKRDIVLRRLKKEQRAHSRLLVRDIV